MKLWIMNKGEKQQTFSCFSQTWTEHTCNMVLGTIQNIHRRERVKHQTLSRHHKAVDQFWAVISLMSNQIAKQNKSKVSKSWQLKRRDNQIYFEFLSHNFRYILKIFNFTTSKVCKSFQISTKLNYFCPSAFSHDDYHKWIDGTILFFTGGWDAKFVLPDY